jgi:hypothetical protein
MKHGRWAMTIGFLCPLFLFPPSLRAAWKGKQDNKPVTELQRMPDSELCLEANSVCLRATIWEESTPGVAQEGTAYIQTIQRVARQRHKGAPPQWASDFLQAITDKDGDRCTAIFAECVKQIQGGDTQPTPPTKVPTPKKPQPK